MEAGDIRERILHFLKIENKSSSVLAQEIGVQASGVSHILSGRNKPSLDFVIKMLMKYRHVSPEWLLFGTGNMNRPGSNEDLFSIKTGGEEKLISLDDNKHADADAKRKTAGSSIVGIQEVSASREKPARIIIFYDDNTFVEYFPQ